MAFNKILAPLVRSESATVILKEAMKLAQDNNSKLMLFHSVDWDFSSLTDIEAEVDFSGTYIQARQEKLQLEIQETKDWLQIYVEQATAMDIPTESKCEVGHPGALIRDLAKDWNADLIVMGRRGLNSLQEVFLGSVSNYILHHAPCSVLVVHGE
ncbi:universal stress protein [Pleurocapsales cyanobacterium LEGE 10410]|nr:universal stress protein [Pleurocapsales cyanobacterium LEGE 10410]